MNMFERLFFISIPVLFALAGMGESLRDQKLFVDDIDPMIGASTMEAQNPGKTCPVAATPFGLVQFSPDRHMGTAQSPGHLGSHQTACARPLTVETRLPNTRV
jgi:putative alpha-1,2-mannosidase